MAKIFGKANDFYRVRIINIKEDEEVDIDWRDDILLRKPENHESILEDNFVIEVVNIDSGEKIALEKFPKLHRAKKQIIEIEEDLNELTKNQFEKKYNFQTRKEV